MKKQIYSISIVLFFLANNILAQTTGLDSTFSFDGKVAYDFSNSDEECFASVIQPNGKIILAGYTMCCLAGGEKFAMIRFNTNGTIDNSFGASGKVVTAININTDIALAVALQLDGKIILAGQTFVAPPYSNYFAIARYDSTGTLDNTFGTGGKITATILGRVNSILVQPDVHDSGLLHVGRLHRQRRGALAYSQPRQPGED